MCRLLESLWYTPETNGWGSINLISSSHTYIYLKEGGLERLAGGNRRQLFQKFAFVDLNFLLAISPGALTLPRLAGAEEGDHLKAGMWWGVLGGLWQVVGHKACTNWRLT